MSRTVYVVTRMESLTPSPPGTKREPYRRFYEGEDREEANRWKASHPMAALLKYRVTKTRTGEYWEGEALD